MLLIQKHMGCTILSSELQKDIENYQENIFKINGKLFTAAGIKVNAAIENYCC